MPWDRFKSIYHRLPASARENYHHQTFHKFSNVAMREYYLLSFIDFEAFLRYSSKPEKTAIAIYGQARRVLNNNFQPLLILLLMKIHALFRKGVMLVTALLWKPPEDPRMLKPPSTKLPHKIKVFMNEAREKTGSKIHSHPVTTEEGEDRDYKFNGYLIHCGPPSLAPRQARAASHTPCHFGSPSLLLSPPAASVTGHPTRRVRQRENKNSADCPLMNIH